MTIFGTVINLPHEAGTIVFIVVLIFLMIFEGGSLELPWTFYLSCVV